MALAEAGHEQLGALPLRVAALAIAVSLVALAAAAAAAAAAATAAALASRTSAALALALALTLVLALAAGDGDGDDEQVAQQGMERARVGLGHMAQRQDGADDVAHLVRLGSVGRWGKRG